MKQSILYTLALILAFACTATFAGPEEDRLALLDHYKKSFPTVKTEDYIFGSLALNDDGKDQYDDMMAFPPYIGDVRQGGVIWAKHFANGQQFENCFKNKGVNAAASFPYFDDTTGKVVTFENAINNCLKANGEKEFAYGSRELGLATIYAKSLSDNARVKIRLQSPGAIAAYERGKKTYYERRGDLNFACATCHVDNAGKRLRTETLSMMIGHATHWPEFRAGTELVTLQGRFTQCQKNTKAKPFELNSQEYNELEFFMTYMSNGLKMLTPVFRK